jgi:hypothetical protein
VSPRRSDYRTRKEYRWAKKVEQREMMTRPIVNARPLSARIILTGILWFVVVFAAVGALPRHAGAGWGSLAIVVSTAAAIVFYRSRLCQRWGRAWDDYARKSRIKTVERGDTSIAGRWAANVVQKERGESRAVASAAAAPSQPPAPQQTVGIAAEIDRLAGLRQSGALSEEEFALAKAKLLG